MKNITKIIARDGLTPFERVQLIVRNDLHKHNTGNNLIPEADLIALTPQSSSPIHEINTYNMYINGWNTFEYLTLDMQTTYFKTLLSISRLQTLVDSCRRSKTFSAKILIKDDYDDLFVFALKHTGFEYNQLVHAYTFEQIPVSLQKDMLTLDPENNYEYWLQEAQLAEIVTGKTELVGVEIDQLTKLIVGHIPWGDSFDMGVCKLSIKQCIFNGYFAGYPMIEFGKRIAAEQDITYTNDDDLRRILAKLSNLKHTLTQTVRDTVAEGFFFDEYIPLCNGTGRKTIHGTTKQTHANIMKEWLKARKSTIDMLRTHIEAGGLELQTQTSRFFETSKDTMYVTGTSLYQADTDLPFVSAYKQHIEEMVPNLYPHYFVQLAPIISGYSTLLMFKEIADQISAIYDLPMSEQVEQFLSEVRESTNLLHLSLSRISDSVHQDQWKNNDTQYRLQTFLPELSVPLEKATPDHNKITKSYEDKLVKVFGGRWCKLNDSHLS